MHLFMGLLFPILFIPLCIFIFLPEIYIFFNTYVSVGLQEMNSLDFLYVKISLSVLFLKDLFSGYDRLTIFSQSTFKMLFHCFFAGTINLSSLSVFLGTYCVFDFKVFIFTPVWWIWFCCVLRLSCLGFVVLCIGKIMVSSN